MLEVLNSWAFNIVHCAFGLASFSSPLPLDVPDPDQDLSAPDEPELAAGGGLDRRGIIHEPMSHLAQPGILLPQPREVAPRIVVRAMRANGFREPVLADQTIGEEDARREEDRCSAHSEWNA
jgi:hypothetical protein